MGSQSSRESTVGVHEWTAGEHIQERLWMTTIPYINQKSAGHVASQTPYSKGKQMRKIVIKNLIYLPSIRQGEVIKYFSTN